jgi:hypothetical protein
MATERLQLLGDRKDFDIRRGTTFGPFQHQLNHAGSGEPLDLTGYQFRGQIRRNERSPTIVQSFEFDSPSPTEGWYEFWLTDEQTLTLGAGATLSSPQSNYVYDLEMESPDGSVTALLHGKIRVQAEVTR